MISVFDVLSKRNIIVRGWVIQYAPWLNTLGNTLQTQLPPVAASCRSHPQWVCLIYSNLCRSLMSISIAVLPHTFAAGASACTPCTPGSYSNSTGSWFASKGCLNLQFYRTFNMADKMINWIYPSESDRWSIWTSIPSDRWIWTDGAKRIRRTHLLLAWHG